jgi:hypothetical protein
MGKRASTGPAGGLVIPWPVDDNAIPLPGLEFPIYPVPSLEPATIGISQGYLDGWERPGIPIVDV